jgi:transposase-like protein
MGLSRRTFTKEFKLAAVRRLKQGVSIGEVARALEVNANVLHRRIRVRRVDLHDDFAERARGRDKHIDLEAI